MFQKQEKEKFLRVALRRIVILRNFLVSGIKIFISEPYWKDRTTLIAFILSALANVALWIFLFRNQRNGEYPIILHYDFFGVDYLGNYNKVYMVPAVGVIVILVNTALGYLLYTREKLASYLLSFNVLLVQMFLLFAGYLIIKVNS